MKHIKRMLMVGIACFGAHIIAEEVPGKRELLPPLLQALRETPKMFQAVTSLEYESARQIELGQNAQLPTKGYRTGTLLWKSRGPLYYYEVTPVRRIKENDTMTVAFDGKHAQHFEPNEQTLTLKKEDFKSLPGTLADDIIAPFVFLPKEVRENATFSDARLALVSSLERWEELIREVKYVGRSEKPGEEYQIFDLPGPPWDGATIYRVYFSISERYPMKWELLNAKHEILMRYSVQLLDKVPLDGDSAFKYPAIATKESFGMGTTESPIQERPLSTVTFKVTNVRVNHVIDDEKFTIEPTTASKIVDLESGTVITVPR